MRLMFWLSLFLIFFAYAGYPICLYIRARYWPKPIQRSSIFPRITIVMAVHNEEEYLLRKLNNLAALDYPADRLEAIVVSDGSTDKTDDILREWQGPNRLSLILQSHLGKANALNHAIAEARGEVVCFTDARQIIAQDGLKNLMSNFADPSVGCASGSLAIHENETASHADGVSLYWRLEKRIRNWEGLIGSTVGATGAFYAVRKDLLSQLPIGTILDDVYIPLRVARQNSRVIFDSKALAWDDFKPSSKSEFHRKVRTLVGNYQLLQLAPWILTRSNPLRIQFFCHKLLRLFVPFAMLGALVSALWLRQGVYELALVLQIVLYALSTLTMLRARVGFLSRLSNISLAFVMLNTAAFVAFLYFITGKKAVWAR
jgi:biofilm PGA synthesis N-glycosyltransferase PgaC